jgi:hypothetical protein
MDHNGLCVYITHDAKSMISEKLWTLWTTDVRKGTPHQAHQASHNAVVSEVQGSLEHTGNH